MYSYLPLLHFSNLIFLHFKYCKSFSSSFATYLLCLYQLICKTSIHFFHFSFSIFSIFSTHNTFSSITFLTPFLSSMSSSLIQLLKPLLLLLLFFPILLSTYQPPFSIYSFIALFQITFSLLC